MVKNWVEKPWIFWSVIALNVYLTVWGIVEGYFFGYFVGTITIIVLILKFLNWNEDRMYKNYIKAVKERYKGNV